MVGFTAPYNHIVFSDGDFCFALFENESDRFFFAIVEHGDGLLLHFARKCERSVFEFAGIQCAQVIVVGIIHQHFHAIGVGDFGFNLQFVVANVGSAVATAKQKTKSNR